MVRTVNVTYVSSCSAGPPCAYLVPNVLCCSAFCCSVLFCFVFYGVIHGGTLTLTARRFVSSTTGTRCRPLYSYISIFS